MTRTRVHQSSFELGSARRQIRKAGLALGHLAAGITSRRPTDLLKVHGGGHRAMEEAAGEEVLPAQLYYALDEK